ncbi:MAG: hypothetical protein DHS20C13_23320 [Thermodesulfobacteriota bacterium]|nr:MAG: hypothetical protein DHS20C13_23320 [Thermodesulfobacteriota bacterium]
MINIDAKTFEQLISDFIDARDISSLVNEFSKDRAFYYNVLKDISRGQSSVNYKILKKVALKKKVSENFIIEQAKFVLGYIVPYDRPDLDKYYKILNVSPNASKEKIRQQWIKLMKSNHPDKVGQDGLDRAKQINEAYGVLNSSKKKTDYNSQYFPDVPVIVKDVGKENRSKMYIYLVPFILVIGISYFYLSSSGLLKSGTEKESFAKRIEIPILPDRDIKNEQSYKELEPSPKLVELDKETQNPEDVFTNNIAKKSPNTKKDVTPEHLNKQKDNSRQEPSVALNTENNEETDIKGSDNNPKSAPDEVSYYKTELDQDEISLENMDSENQDSQSLYIVKKGDSLWTISRKFGVSVEDISEQNKLINNKLDIGDQIILPDKEKTEQVPENSAEFVKIIPDESEIKKINSKQESIETKATNLTGSSDVTGSFDSNLATSAVAVSDAKLRKNELLPNMSSPGEDSLNRFVLQYVSAYKNRDLQTLRSLFAPNATENEVSIDKFLDSYKSTFSTLEIIRYDINVNRAKVDKLAGFIMGDFIVTFKNVANKVTKSSQGKITWFLRWRGNNWEIDEINYKIHDTKVINL